MDLTTEQITYLIKSTIGKDWTYARIEREFNLAPYTARKSTYYPHLKGEQAIAKLLGIHPKYIWPSRYHENGVRINKPHSKNNSNKKNIVNVNKVYEIEQMIWEIRKNAS